MKLFQAAVIVCCCILTVFADIYLHNPRGSNNRLDEEGRERNNANRLFDSQNNNRGGYNVGSVYYYSGSILQLEWTNQHSCNNENNHCEVIIQYMCGPLVRDGATTTTIPKNPMDCVNYDCNTDKEYGMHENFEHFLECDKRKRNGGLFTADQKVGGSARSTRQNPNANRQGYECAEERDYYPYWHDSPWKDIVVMTNDATRCPYYQEQSQNVKSRWHCSLPRMIMYKAINDNNLKLPNNEEECKAFTYKMTGGETIQAQWVEIPAHGLPPPECMENQFSRDNHLGNGLGGHALSYNWTIPDINEENCVLRIRYNISTGDYEAWNDVNATQNRQVEDLNLAPLVGFSSRQEAKLRKYEFKNNPEVEIFKGLDLAWRLAINTAQFGRTFQDRSHTFAIRSRPEGLEDVVIHNVNVRGKRGNIVQVYPAVEYDFIPNTLSAKPGDYVHFQWTGSNTNPGNNDGQGRQGTDRSNIVLQSAQVYTEGSGFAYKDYNKFGHWGRSYPEILDNTHFLGLSRADLIQLAMLGPQFRGEMSELDDAGTYFDLGPRQITSQGIYHYMSTRNNNFSNRSQKGRIIVRSYVEGQKSVGWNGGNFTLPDGQTYVEVPQGAFQNLQNMRIQKWDKDEAKENLRKAEKTPPNDNFAGDVVVMHPEGKLTMNEKTITLLMSYEASALHEPVVYMTETNALTWERVETSVQSGRLEIATDRGGVYVATNQLRGGAVAGIVIAVLVLMVAIIVAVVCMVRRPPTGLSRLCAKQI